MRLAALRAKDKRAAVADNEPAVSPAAGPLVNGFLAIPEPEALSCKAENIAAFTLPVEALDYEVDPAAAVVAFKNGDRERQIHCNTELRADEQEKLEALQREAQALRLRFFPSVTAMATRFLSTTRMNTKKALKLMQSTQEWRQTYFRDGPLTDDSVQEDMAHGIVYFSGRDNALRPALVVRGSRIPQQWYRERRVDKLVRLLVFCMEYMLRHMVVPGKVENLCVIVDLKGLSLAQVSLSALGEVYKVMSNHYAGRVFRFYVCHLPPALHMVAGVAKTLLTDRQRQKLVVLDDVKELRRHYAAHQLEQDLGGARPEITQFFPFPLQAGPFASGSEHGPDEAAAPGMHEVLTAWMAMGRLWDPARSREDNCALECKPPEALGLAPHHDAPELTPRPCTDSKGSIQSLKNFWYGVLDETSDDANAYEVLSVETGNPEIQEDRGGTELEGPIVYSQGCLLSCRPCWL